MNYKKIVINGKFLSQKVTGVQRYAREILSELDKLLDDSVEVVLAVERNIAETPEYKHIKVERVGRLKGNMWEQIDLPFYVLINKALCVSLCNMTPIFTPHVVALHDMNFKVNKHYYSKLFWCWYNFVYALVAQRVKAILTVSDFSKNEICRLLSVRSDKVYVTYNGWQHFERIAYDEDALEKYGLASGQYFFAMSSMAPNKNFAWIAKAAANNPTTTFAVSGAVNKKVFGDSIDFEIPSNLLFLGYVSDSEAKTLMRECKAFLFPTYYEGFGIPPLEAFAAGAPAAVVSDRSCMREIYGNCVHYIDPDDYDVDLEILVDEKVQDSTDVLEKYSWKNAAELIFAILTKEVASQ